MANHPKHKQSNRHATRGAKTARPRTAPERDPDQKRSASSVRIVAGDWRGRKIRVVQADGLRPTGNRVRETLFNWLQLSIPGSRCLDLFAGSGALGLEAASRGAASVTLVESAPIVFQQLQQTLSDLQAGDKVHLYNGNADQYLATSPAPFDIVFVDPPFERQVHQQILETLTPGYLSDTAWLYIELPTQQAAIAENLPESLSVHKRKRFGDVTVLLLRFNR